MDRLLERDHELEPGGVAVVPIGVPHTFLVHSETARVLMISTPAGIERFVRDGSLPALALTLPRLATPRPEPDQVDRIFRAHGVQRVGPSLQADT